MSSDEADSATQGAVDHPYDEAERSAREALEGELANLGAPTHDGLSAGDVAFDLVTRQPLFILDTVAPDLVTHYEREGFDLASYKQHGWLPVTLDDAVYECAFLGGLDDLHSFSNTYHYPSGRLARIPVELAGGDE